MPYPTAAIRSTSFKMPTKRITLLGGSGFVGSQLTYRLAEKFDEVVVLTRRAQRVRTLRTLSNVRIVELNVHHSQALNAALANSSVVINLVGILNEGANKAESSFSSAHSNLTEKVLEACKINGISRYLHMSALNADAEQGSSEYLKTKGLAEQKVRDAGASIQWTIFRPSVIFGKHDAFFNRFASLLGSLPLFPLAVPEAKLAPVYIGDVCQVMIDSINEPGTIGTTIELCGPEDFTLRELVQYTADTAGISSRIIGLPDWASKLQARVMECVPGKPFSQDNYLSLQTDSIPSEGSARQPTSIQAVVPRYIGTEDWSGRLQKRRAAARR